jgi:hypothetical protein
MLTPQSGQPKSATRKIGSAWNAPNPCPAVRSDSGARHRSTWIAQIFLAKKALPAAISLVTIEDMQSLRWVRLLPLMVLIGCAASRQFVAGDQAPEGIRKKFVAESDASHCASHQGVWRKEDDRKTFPLGGYCQFRAADAGRVCKSSKDCVGYCELSFDDPQGESHPHCSNFMPPRWDRCVPGYFENGKVFGRGECFGGDSEVQ